MSTWIPSAEAFGTPSLTSGVFPTGIASAEAFGTAQLVVTSIITVNPVAIPSGEAFGTPVQAFIASPVGVSSGEVIPGPRVKSVITTVLSSGALHGMGSLSIPIQLGSGTFVGTSTLTDPAVIVRSGSGHFYGLGTIFAYSPNPFVGTSSLVANYVVEQAPQPVCGCPAPTPVTTRTCACGGTITVPTETCTCSGKVGQAGFGFGGPFYWNQSYLPGDLTLFLRDSAGPINPNSVSYTLYWIRNGIPFQAGPANRIPGRGPGIGQFYVTGRVGELGQPGQWLVRWRYQRFYFSEINEVEYRFLVQDAVAVNNPQDMTQRVVKYGWD